MNQPHVKLFKESSESGNMDFRASSNCAKTLQLVAKDKHRVVIAGTSQIASNGPRDTSDLDEG
jgi:hypothetical protein